MDNSNRIEELKDEDGYIIIYRRLSVTTTKGVSLAKQLENATRWLKAYNLYDEDKIIVLTDEVTGSTEERDDFQRMIDLLPVTKLIVINDVTRIARRIITTAKFEEKRKQAKTEIVYVHENLQSWNTMTYTILLSIFSAMAEYELEKITVRQRDTKYQMKTDGRGAWIGGKPNYGFKTKKIQEANSEGKIVNVAYMFNVNELLEVVKIIYKKYKETRSIERDVKWLKANNIKDENGKDFTIAKVTEILRTPNYIIPSKEAYEYFKQQNVTINNDIKMWTSSNGIICYNRHSQKKKYDTENKTKHNILPMSEWIISISKHHTGVIPFKLWLECQEIRKSQNNHANMPFVFNQTSVLNGIIFCRDCGEKMYPKYKTKRKDAKEKLMPNGDRMFWYRCRNGGTTAGIGKCNNRSLIHGNEVDNIVINELINMYTIENKTLANELKSASNGTFIGSSNSLVETSLNSLENDLKRCLTQQERYQKLLDTIDVSNMRVVSDISKKLEETYKEIENIKNEIKKINLSNKKLYDPMIEAKRIMENITNLKSLFDNMTIAEKRECVQLLVKEVRLDKEHIDIIFVNDTKKTIELPNGVHSKLTPFITYVISYENFNLNYEFWSNTELYWQAYLYRLFGQIYMDIIKKRNRSNAVDFEKHNEFMEKEILYQNSGILMWPYISSKELTRKRSINY